MVSGLTFFAPLSFISKALQMGRGRNSKYQLKLKQKEKQAQQKARKVQKKETKKVKMAKPLSVVEKHREQHKDKYLWGAVPLFRKDGEPLFWGRLNPYNPARTRDGRPAYIVEVDPRKHKASCVVVHVPNIYGGEDEYSQHCVSLEGVFMASGKPDALDVFNIPVDKWNQKVDEGLLAIRAIDDDTYIQK